MSNGTCLFVDVLCVALGLFQVDRLSAEIHERKKKEREKVDAEVQTEEYTWTETGELCSLVP